MKCPYLEIISIVIGFFAVITVTYLFDRLRWPVFNTWSMAHAGIFVAWPVLSVIAYKAIKFLGTDEKGGRE